MFYINLLTILNEIYTQGAGDVRLDIKSKLSEWKRVLQVARKPTKDELMSSSKICMLGIALIGAIGFAIFLMFALIGI